jgi:hypothetical protein
MDQLIPIASKLQDVLGAVGQNTQLDLPQIVVVRRTTRNDNLLQYRLWTEYSVPAFWSRD